MVDRDKNGYVKAPELKSTRVRKPETPEQKSGKYQAIQSGPAFEIKGKGSYSRDSSIPKQALVGLERLSPVIHAAAFWGGGPLGGAITMGLHGAARSFAFLMTISKTRHKLKLTTSLSRLGKNLGASLVAGSLFGIVTFGTGSFAKAYVDDHIAPTPESTAFTNALVSQFANNEAVKIGGQKLKLQVGDKTIFVTNMKLNKKSIAFNGTKLGSYWQISGKYQDGKKEKEVSSANFPRDSLMKDFKQGTVFVSNQKYFKDLYTSVYGADTKLTSNYGPQKDNRFASRPGKVDAGLNAVRASLYKNQPKGP